MSYYEPGSPFEDWEDAAAGLHLPWPGSMALQFIDEGTVHLAHVVKDGVTHPEGCLCPYCSELRRAGGKMRNLDKHIAMIMAQGSRKPCGCPGFTLCLCHKGKAAGRTRAEQEAIDQKAAAMQSSAVTGSKPSGPFSCPGCGFRFGSAPTADTTCQYCGHALPAQDPQPGPWRATWAWASAVACSCGRDPDSVTWDEHASGCQRRTALIEVMRSEAGQWWEETRAIILPDYGHFVKRVPDQPPGTCRECHTGPLWKGQLCFYCDLREERAIVVPALAAQAKRPAPPAALLADHSVREAARETARRKRIARRLAADPVLKRRLQTGMLGFACCVLALHIPALHLLIIPGVVFLAVAFTGGRRL